MDNYRRADVLQTRGQRRWVLPLILLLIIFAVPSVKSGAIADSQQITELIRSVLSQPWSESVPVLLPIAKLVLLVVAMLGIAGIGPYPKVVLGYYATILTAVAIFQNTATLVDGVAILVGNMLAQLVVAAVCILGLRRTAASAPLQRERLWLLPLMLWAWLYPFALDAGTVVPGGGTEMLINSAGVTYCMVTPVIAGTMALRSAAYDITTRTIVGWLGLIFGLLNMMTWFVINPANWWMGTLHVPLLIVAAFLTITSWREGRGGEEHIVHADRGMDRL